MSYQQHRAPPSQERKDGPRDRCYNLRIMIDSTRLSVFLCAAILLAVAPGPGMLYVLARTLAGGRREGLLSALGTLLGGMVHVFAAAGGCRSFWRNPQLLLQQ